MGWWWRESTGVRGRWRPSLTSFASSRSTLWKRYTQWRRLILWMWVAYTHMQTHSVEVSVIFTFCEINLDHFFSQHFCVCTQQRSKRNIIGYFEKKDCDNYHSYEKVANILRDDCTFLAAFGWDAVFWSISHNHSAQRSLTVIPQFYLSSI